MTTVVRFDGVSKRYRLGAGQGSLREVLTALPRRPSGGGPDDGADNFWALRDVSFDLQAGQVLGFIGRNGAGKTTALKLLSRVVRPTTGQIEVNGRVSALIELGAGFHPDLTGRENVYLNGVILGMGRHEIDRKFDRIVEFAELERFIDTPVKRYSSGMYARLGFAVAAHAEPDLLLVDEVLAVGDLAFQRKCYDFITSFVASGKTAVFVSHNTYVVEQLCTQLIWLDGGRVVAQGQPNEVLPSYLDAQDQRMLSTETAVADGAGGTLELGTVRFLDTQGGERDTFLTGEDVIVSIRYYASVRLERPHFCLGVASPDGGALLFTASMLADGGGPPFIEGTGELECRFGSVPLLPRVYTLWCEVYAADRSGLLVNWRKLGAFRVASPSNGDVAEADRGAIKYVRADAPISVPHQWAYPGVERKLATERSAAN